MGAIAVISCLAAFAGPVTFTDQSAQLTVRVHTNGGDGRVGAALLDHDGDGDLDLYMSNGIGSPNALYRNDAGVLTEGAGPAGAQVGTGSSGVLAADLDGDGWTDLLLTGEGGLSGVADTPLVVLRNDGDGTFTDVSAQTGITGNTTQVMASAADIDGDDDLDVFVVAPGSIGQGVLHENHLYRNDGGWSFTEIGAEARVDTQLGACASAFTHIDDDDAIDLIVANCNDPNYVTTPFEMHRNDGTGHFEDVAVDIGVWGLGYWMSVVLGDFDGNGYQDFFSSNVGTEFHWFPHAFYLADAAGYRDRAVVAGVAAHAYGWGGVAADLDNDGHQDLYYVGSSRRLMEDADGVRMRFPSPGNLFWNQGDGTFAEPEIPRDLTDLYTTTVVAGDLSGNGAPDLLITAASYPALGLPGTPVLLFNDGTDHHWLTVRLRGTPGNRAGIGARLTATAGGRNQLREVTAGSGFAATSSPWPTFGLGDETAAQLCVRWPDGSVEDFGEVAADQRVDLVHGAGIAADACGERPPEGGDDTGDTGLGSTDEPGTTDPTGPADPDPDPTADEDPASSGRAPADRAGGCAVLPRAAGGWLLVLLTVALARLRWPDRGAG